MNRRLWSLVGSLTLGATLSVHATEGVTTTPAPAIKEITQKRQQVLEDVNTQAQRYRQLRIDLARMAQRLENSEKAEERAKAKVFQEALKLAQTSNVEARFEKLIELLKSKDANVDEISRAYEEDKQLVVDISAMLKLLLTSGPDQLNAIRGKMYERLLKNLKRLERDQIIVRNKTKNAGPGDVKKLEEEQRKIAEEIANIQAQINGNEPTTAKPGDAKPSKPSDKPSKPSDKPSASKPSDPSKPSEPNAGEPKPGPSSESPPSSSKPSPPSNGPSSPSSSKPSPQKPQPPKDDDPNAPAVRPVIDDAKNKADDAARQLPNNPNNAVPPQDETIDALKKAQKKIEDILAQIREEELKRRLAGLLERFKKMADMQEKVLKDTVDLDKTIGANEDRQPNRADAIRSVKMSDEEKAILEMAGEVVRLLQGSDDAEAVQEVIQQVRSDMSIVTRRLGKTDVGTTTQRIEQDVIDQLKGVAEALKDRLANLNNPPPPPGGGNPGGGQPSDPKLIKEVQELKIIRAMQDRVHKRTKMHGEDNPADPNVREELEDLSQRQKRIAEIVKKKAMENSEPK